MTAEPRVIDLGEFVYGSGPEPMPARWRRRYRTGVRWWAPAVLIVMLAATMAGASGPPAPALQRLWTAPDSPRGEPWQVGYAADEHRLYLAAADRLIAYRLADGQVEWEVRLPAAEDDWVTVQLVAGRPVVTIAGSRLRTVGYQPETGQERWRHPGLPDGEAGGRLILRDEVYDQGGDFESVTALDPATGRATGTVRLAGVETEGTIWFPHTGVWQAPDGDINLLALDHDGWLTRHDLATGTAAARVRTPHRERPDGSTNSLRVIGNMVVVGDQAGDPPAVAGYDASTLDRRWTLPHHLWPIQCGTAVCLEREAAGAGRDSIRVVDPVAGQTRWSLDCSADATDRQACQVRELARDDRLWIEEVRWRDGGPLALERATSWIVDARTGEPLSGTIGWRLSRLVGDSGLLLTRTEPAPGLAPDGRGHSWWAWSDDELSGLAVVGAIEASICDPWYPYLVCGTEREDGSLDELSVWRVGS